MPTSAILPAPSERAPAWISIDEAIDVFVRGFSFMKSFAHPYVAERIGPLWVLRDSPPRRRPRKLEIVAHGVEPAEVVRVVREAGLGWHFLCHLHEHDGEFAAVREGYKAEGYRALETEWMFARDLAGLPVLTSDPPVQRVRTDADAERLRRTSRSRPILREHLAAEPAPQRLYAAMDERAVYGWVSSIPFGARAWVADLFVRPEHRGRGFGRALMSALLADDRRHGIETSVLLASSDGARLYPHLGYRRLATVQIFCPRR
jgi:GNAT superfamily N-acetyltransferase